jgi:hypothetical protein
MEQMNILGSIIDTSFGRSSIRDAGHGIKVAFSGTKSDDSGVINPILEIRFETQVNFNPRTGLSDQRKNLDDQSQKALSDRLAEVKKEFKTETGVALKCTEILAPDSIVEHISHNPGLVRARYFRSLHYEITT